MASVILTKNVAGMAPAAHTVRRVLWYLPNGMDQHTPGLSLPNATVTASDIVVGQTYRGTVTAFTDYRQYDSDFTFTSGGLMSDANPTGQSMTSTVGTLAVTTP